MIFGIVCGGPSVLSVVVEEDLQPARTGGDKLSGVAGAPALRKADAHTVGVIRSIQEVGLSGVPQKARPVIVKHLDGEARHHLSDHQGSAVGNIQGGGVDEDGVIAAVVGPNAIRLFAEEDAVSDFASCALNSAAAMFQVELAQAETCALR